MARTVQFVDVESAVTAFENTECVGWSIWSGTGKDKYMHFSFTGSCEECCESLRTMLERLQHSAAIYTVCCYDEPGEKITDKTPYFQAFNVQLRPNAGLEMQRGNLQPNYANNNPLLQQLIENQNKINDRMDFILEQLAAKDEPEQKEPDLIGGLVTQLISNPEQLIGLIGAVKVLFSKNDNTANDQSNQLGTPFSTDADLINAVGDIEKVEPDARKYLFKLAAMANDNPKKVKGIFATLRMFIK